MKDFGTSKSPKSTRSSTTHWCPGRPGHPAFRHNIASSLRLHTGLPYDWTPRSDAPLGSPLAPSARRVSRVASRLPGTTRLRFALHGGQRMSNKASSSFSGASVCRGSPIHHQYHKVNLPRSAFFVAEGFVFPWVPAESCGKLRTSRVSQPPSPTLDSSLIAPFLSVFERVNMRRSPEVRDIPCPGTPAPGPAHL